ncbi:MAG: hypothetical protein M1829_002523 [Trizodia sp. TS-e1964]|nr:MAG: hypothetical protein M1829_002523 [Trizodia sp. TS-e1964]
MALSLRILVPVKRVIDYTVKPRINATRTAIDATGLKHSMNPFDELSVEAALQLRERGPLPVPDILAVSAGPPSSLDAVRTALAMGADRGVLVACAADTEPLGVAKVLAALVRREKRNLVILGKQSIDSDSAQTGPMLAGLLGWAQAVGACGVRVGEGGEVEVTREVDGGTEIVRAQLPMVITADLRLNTPRYATLPGVMRAKKKVVEKVGVEELGVDVARRVSMLKVEEPRARVGGAKVGDVDGLLARLRELGAL